MDRIGNHVTLFSFHQPQAATVIPAERKLQNSKHYTHVMMSTAYLEYFFMELRCRLVAPPPASDDATARVAAPQEQEVLQFPYLRSFHVDTAHVLDEESAGFATRAMDLLASMPFVEHVHVPYFRDTNRLAATLQSKKEVSMLTFRVVNQRFLQQLFRPPSTATAAASPTEEEEGINQWDLCRRCTTLRLPNSYLSNPAIDCFTMLTTLDITGSRLSDVTVSSSTLRQLYANDSRLTDAGLKGCVNLAVLHAANCPGVTTIEPFASTLTELDASGTCGIGDADLVCFSASLKVLKASKNAKLKELPPSCLPWLRELDVSGTCGVHSVTLLHLPRLRKLNVSNNTKIPNFDSQVWKQLNELDCEGAECFVTDAEVEQCTSLVRLNARNNRRVTLVPHSVRVLNASGPDCGIDDDGLEEATLLVDVNVSGNRNVFKPTCFGPSLLKLDVSNDNSVPNHLLQCSLHNDGLRRATNLQQLVARDNAFISDLQPCASQLRALDASGSMSALSDEALRPLHSLTTLNASGNAGITSVAPFATSLLHLDASRACCGIGDAGLTQAAHLVQVMLEYNYKVRTCLPFAQSLRCIEGRGELACSFLFESNRKFYLPDSACGEIYGATPMATDTTCFPGSWYPKK